MRRAGSEAVHMHCNSSNFCELGDRGLQRLAQLTSGRFRAPCLEQVGATNETQHVFFDSLQVALDSALPRTLVKCTELASVVSHPPLR